MHFQFFGIRRGGDKLVNSEFAIVFEQAKESAHSNVLLCGKQNPNRHVCTVVAVYCRNITSSRPSE